jgi:hypothetical protein
MSIIGVITLAATVPPLAVRMQIQTILPSVVASLAASTAVMLAIRLAMGPELPRCTASRIWDRQSVSVGAVDVIVGSPRAHKRRARCIDVLFQREEIRLRTNSRRRQRRQNCKQERDLFHTNRFHARWFHAQI